MWHERPITANVGTSIQVKCPASMRRIAGACRAVNRIFVYVTAISEMNHSSKRTPRLYYLSTDIRYMRPFLDKRLPSRKLTIKFANANPFASEEDGKRSLITV